MEYTKSEVLSYIADNDVKFIKLFYTDVLGVVKSLTIQPSVLKEAFENGISFDASVVKGFMSIEKSDMFLIPDPTTLQVLPWRPQHGRVARMYCNIRYPDGTQFEGDSRFILKSVVEKAAAMGLDIRVGTECEFYLFKRDENGDPVPVPYDNGTYCSLAPIDKGENVRREIILTLEQMGIEPQTSHHENGPGQNEIDFKYNSAIKAADNFATFKTVVKTIAAKNGVYASFLPKPIEGKPGSGLHVNISLIKDGHNIFVSKSEEAKSFIAGILARITDITAFLNPLEQSYKRLGFYEAPKYISWSSQNRSQLIRIPAAKAEENKRFELRSPDPTCNQYIALALIIAAGLEGIENKLSLSAPCDKNLFNLSEDEVLKLGIKKLPENLKEALSCAKQSEFVKKYIPQILFDEFMNIRENYPDPQFGEY